MGKCFEQIDVVLALLIVKLLGVFEERVDHMLDSGRLD